MDQMRGWLAAVHALIGHSGAAGGPSALGQSERPRRAPRPKFSRRRVALRRSHQPFPALASWPGCTTSGPVAAPTCNAWVAAAASSTHARWPASYGGVAREQGHSLYSSLQARLPRCSPPGRRGLASTSTIALHGLLPAPIGTRRIGGQSVSRGRRSTVHRLESVERRPAPMWHWLADCSLLWRSPHLFDCA